MRKLISVAAVAVMLMIALTGCDKAEEAMESTMEKTDLGATTELTKLIGAATNALGGITDLESAKAALPALQGVDLDLGNLVQKFADMSPEMKSKLTGALTTAMPKLEGAITKVTSLDGVGEIVGPVLESLQAKFKSMM